MTRVPAFRSDCPVCRTLDVIGDRWTLLIVRDLMLGRSTFKELSESHERCATNTLTDRLKRLEQHGLITRSAYQERPVRYAYALTELGWRLKPVMLAARDFGRIFEAEMDARGWPESPESQSGAVSPSA